MEGWPQDAALSSKDAGLGCQTDQAIYRHPRKSGGPEFLHLVTPRAEGDRKPASHHLACRLSTGGEVFREALICLGILLDQISRIVVPFSWIPTVWPSPGIPQVLITSGDNIYFRIVERCPAARFSPMPCWPGWPSRPRQPGSPRAARAATPGGTRRGPREVT